MHSYAKLSPKKKIVCFKTSTLQFLPLTVQFWKMHFKVSMMDDVLMSWFSFLELEGKLFFPGMPWTNPQVHLLKQTHSRNPVPKLREKHSKDPCHDGRVDQLLSTRTRGKATQSAATSSKNLLMSLKNTRQKLAKRTGWLQRMILICNDNFVFIFSVFKIIS